MDFGTPVLFLLFVGLHLTRVAASESNMAFLGPQGSYSDEATTKYASRAHLTGTTPLITITGTAGFVADDRVQFGLLPFENSTGGSVDERQRLLLAPQDPDWHVVAEVTNPIRNNLLVKPGTRASDLKKILSRPEALKECAS